MNPTTMDNHNALKEKKKEKNRIHILTCKTTTERPSTTGNKQWEVLVLMNNQESSLADETG